jgi:TetR/AcrR family transcriptional regulator, cholesterol catabolism regulator
MSRLKAPQRREQLIGVATRLFAKHGFDATTTASIAEAAGVTEPILYRHFKSKQDLFVAIVRSTSQQTIQEWEDLIADIADPAERIRVIAQAVPGHIKRLADAYHVLHGALSTSRDKKVHAVLREHYDQIEVFFRKVIVDGHKTGVFRTDLDPKSGAWQLILSGIGYAMVTLNLDEVEQPVVDQVIESIVRGWAKG